MNDLNFFNQMVLPAVEGFRRKPGDLLRGVTACIMLQSMTEHYFWQRMADPTKSRDENEPALARFKGTLRSTKVAKANWLFGEIADIANGTKHAKAGFFDLTLQSPAACGVARCGFPLAHEPYVFTDSNHSWLLYQLIDALAELWTVKLSQ